MIARSSLALRAVIVLSGVALLLLPGALHPVPFVLTTAGVLLAVATPRLAGSALATVGFLAAWLAAAGWDGSMATWRAVAAAAALYVLQVSAALAAGVPLHARVSKEVVLRWLRGCAVPVLLAAAFITLDVMLPRRSGTPWLELTGLVGVLLVAVAGVYAVRRRGAPIARMDGRATDQ